MFGSPFEIIKALREFVFSSGSLPNRGCLLILNMLGEELVKVAHVLFVGMILRTSCMPFGIARKLKMLGHLLFSLRRLPDQLAKISLSWKLPLQVFEVLPDSVIMTIQQDKTLRIF
ncbi:hypothetical protein J1N35_003309 [Gossypium stocksii]|uniref:Uncharacterized protein n=1 Tax=Gossypium stocksii TaxID=47602 RepID=A0A9D3WPT9_9ROSI|nr:hypothetical protein J1N35_003309 [Gossypium stocksii]